MAIHPDVKKRFTGMTYDDAVRRIEYLASDEDVDDDDSPATDTSIRMFWECIIPLKLTCG